MTYARLRDLLNMLDQGQLSQEARFLVQGKLERIDYVDSFRLHTTSSFYHQSH